MSDFEHAPHDKRSLLMPRKHTPGERRQIEAIQQQLRLCAEELGDLYARAHSYTLYQERLARDLALHAREDTLEYVRIKREHDVVPLILAQIDEDIMNTRREIEELQSDLLPLF
jgi:hypothetical protein